MKKLFLIILAIIVIVPAAAAVWLLFFFDANNYKSQIEDGFRKATGREIEISGDLNASVFPRIGLTTGAITIGNAPGFGDQPFAAIQGSSVSLALLPLLKGEVEMDKLVLDGVQANLVTLKDGKTNWEDLVGGSEQSKTEKPTQKKTTKEGESGKAIGALAIGGIELKDANILWDDRSADTRVALQKMNLETGAISFAEAIPVNFSTDFDMNRGEIGGNMEASTDITINKGLDRITLAGLDATVKASGSLLENGKLDTQVTANSDIDLKSELIRMKAAKLVIGLDGGSLGDTHTKTMLSSDITINMANEKITLAGTQLQVDADGELFEGGNMKAVVKSDILVDMAAQKVTSKRVDATVDLASDMVPVNPMKATISSPLTVMLDKLSVDFPDMKYTIPGSQGTGSLMLSKFDQPLPAVVLTLDTPEFNADPWLGAETGGSAVIEHEPATLLSRSIIQTAIAQTTEATGAGAVEIPVELIRDLDIDAKLTMGSFIMQGLHATELKAVLKGKNGVVRFEPMEAKLFQGQFNGLVHIDARGKLPKVRVKEKLTEVQIAEVIDYTMPDNAKDWLTGVAEVNSDVHTQGLDTGAMTQALNGLVDANVRDGYLEGISLRKMIDKAKAAIEHKPYQDDGSPDRTKILEMGLDAKIVNGVANSDVIKVLTPLVDVAGNGQADLYHETLDYDLKLTLSSGISDIDKAKYKKLQGHAIPLKISGSFANPKVNLDLGGLVKEEAKKRIEKEIDKKLEKKLGDKLGDELGNDIGNKLKGLFGK